MLRPGRRYNDAKLVVIIVPGKKTRLVANNPGVRSLRLERFSVFGGHWFAELLNQTLFMDGFAIAVGLGLGQRNQIPANRTAQDRVGHGRRLA